MLFAAALGTAFGASPLPFNSIGPFTKPLAEEFGWGRGDIQLALFCFTAAVVFTVPYIGGLADRIGEIGRDQVRGVVEQITEARLSERRR